MNTVTGDLAADPSLLQLRPQATAPTASLWQWLAARFDRQQLSARWSARQQANALRGLALGMHGDDRRLANDLLAAADMHEQRHDH